MATKITKKTTFKDLEPDFIEYKGKKYKSWTIEDDNHEESITFAEYALQDELFDEDSGHYTDKEAQYIDDDIGFFVDEDDKVKESVKEYYNEYK